MYEITRYFESYVVTLHILSEKLWRESLPMVIEILVIIFTTVREVRIRVGTKSRKRIGIKKKKNQKYR